MIRIRRSIAVRMAVAILGATFILFTSLLLLNYFYCRQMIERYAKENAHHFTSAIAQRINKELSSVEKVPLNLAGYLELNPTQDETRFVALIKKTVEVNPEIFGTTVAFEPFQWKNDVERYAPYVCRRAGQLQFIQLTGNNYDYFPDDWYQIPKELGRPYWTQPYYDEGGGECIMSTYSVPLFGSRDDARELIGIVTADVSLDWLRQIVSGIKVLKTGYGFIISSAGVVVSHPDPSLIMRETIFSVAEERGDQRLRRIGQEMIRGKSGLALTQSIMTGRKCWLAYEPIPANGWSLGVLFPYEELMADLLDLNRNIILLAVIYFIVLIAIIILISRSITGPLRKLSKLTEHIAAGELDMSLAQIKTEDEVGQLSAAFSKMVHDLKNYIRELTEATAARQRMESELSIAKKIQESVLPRELLSGRGYGEIDLYAKMVPAREIGGDLYDFYPVGVNRIGILVGDVSGKGIPAALFMMEATTLVRSIARQGKAPSEVVADVNTLLAESNEESMFVTLFYGVLDLVDGKFVFCNAGHNPPLMIRNNEVHLFSEGRNMPVGVTAGVSFIEETMCLVPGDRIILYTDGCTEAMDKGKEMFGLERFKGLSLKTAGVSSGRAGEAIAEEILAFQQEVGQADDLTLLIVSLVGLTKDRQ